MSMMCCLKIASHDMRLYFIMYIEDKIKKVEVYMETTEKSKEEIEKYEERKSLPNVLMIIGTITTSLGFCFDFSVISISGIIIMLSGGLIGLFYKK